MLRPRALPVCDIDQLRGKVIKLAEEMRLPDPSRVTEPMWTPDVFCFA